MSVLQSNARLWEAVMLNYAGNAFDASMRGRQPCYWSSAIAGNAPSCGRLLSTSAFYSRQLCLCPFPAYNNNNNNTLIYIAPACRMTSEALSIQSRYLVNYSFPSTKWSETCTTTLILLTSVSFRTIWGGGCGVCKYCIGPIGDLSLLTATAAAAAYVVCIESLK